MLNIKRDELGRFVKGSKARDNGRTLCIDCHRKTETYGGKTKNEI